MNFEQKILTIISLINIPNIAIAMNTSFSSLLGKLIDIINIYITPMLLTLAVVIFFYHTGKGVFGQGKDSGEAQTRLKQTLLWGVIIVFVMVSIGGILNMIGGEFDLMKSRADLFN